MRRPRWFPWACLYQKGHIGSLMSTWFPQLISQNYLTQCPFNAPSCPNAKNMTFGAKFYTNLRSTITQHNNNLFLCKNTDGISSSESIFWQCQNVIKNHLLYLFEEEFMRPLDLQVSVFAWIFAPRGRLRYEAYENKSF